MVYTKMNRLDKQHHGVSGERFSKILRQHT